MIEDLAKAEKTILRKILGPIKEGDQYRSRHNNELYKHIEKITDTIRKRTVFYGHLQRMNSNRLTGRIFKYSVLENWKWPIHGSMKLKNDIEELQITHEDFIEHTPLRNKLHNFKGF